MSKKLLGVEGDHVQCTHCTCMPSKSQNSKKKTVQCGLNHKHLKNWQKWIVERKHVHERLTNSLDRCAGDLLMNLDEEYRRIQEERLLFEYCKINTNFDKYRGNPAFWKVPVGLTDKFDRSLDPTYFVSMTKVEQNEIPLIEYVTTPNHIKNEKNILPCNRSLYATRKIDNKNMEVLFSKIEQYRPKCNDLMVVGEKIQYQEEMLNDANQSLKDNASKEFHDLSTDEQVIGEFSSAKMPTTPKICFEINETMVSEYNDLANSVLKIRLIFECTRNQKTPGVKYIKFKNRGLATVRFYWNRVEKFLLFRDIIKCDRDESHTFYFNKNELLLPPAETLDFPIWFKSNNIGNYLEMWEITTKPKMWDTDFKLIVNLQGYVYPYGFDEKSKYITEILDKRIAKTAIRGVLNDILQHLKFAESEANSFAFTDRQLFESLNQELWGIEKRPKYMYDKNAVGKLILLYEEMKLSHTSDYWNYSIKELRMMARKKDIWIYVQNETNKMLREKQKRIELNAYTKKNTKNSMQTIELVPPLEDDNETYCQRLDSILQNLERPSMIPNTQRLKYFTVYSIIRNFSFQICNALEKFDNSANPVCDDCYPCYDYKNVNAIEQMPERLLFERFDDIWIDRTKINTSQGIADFIAKPKPEVLKSIPVGDTKSLYKIYFNTGDIDEKDKRKYNRNEEQEKTNRSKEMQAQNQGASGSYMTTVKEGFDPFGEEYVPDVAQIVSVPRLKSTCSIQQVDFNYQKYLIVFTYLSKAVDAMVDALETLKESALDIQVLAELTKCGDISAEKFQSSPKKLVQPEGYGTETTMLLVNDPYFHNLLDNHLNKNQHTKEYIVEGRRKISREENMQPNSPGTADCVSLNSWLSKSHESITESIKSKISAGVQTTEIDDDFKESLNDLRRNVPYVTSASSSSSEKLSHDNFYFVNDEEVLDEKKPTI